MEKHPSTIPMETIGKILGRSIHIFLGNYQYFTTTSVLLVFPFSAAFLFSQILLPSSPPLLLTIHNHLNSLFQSAGFSPSSSQLFTFLNLKISQTLTSSILVLPSSLSFLLISKASVILSLKNHEKASFLSLYNPILVTQVCNYFLILSANATCFSLLFIAFSCLESFGYSSTSSILFLSSSGAILYSIVLANSILVCNLALISSGMDKSGGYSAILKACVLLKGRTTTALALIISVNMALAAVEALFQYRVVRAFYIANNSTALEGIFIAYLYSIVIVMDTIVSCELYKSCKREFWIDEEEGGYTYWSQIEGQNGKTIEEFVAVKFI